MSDEPAHPRAGSVFREPYYARFWISRSCSTLSYQMVGVAVGWQVYALTHSTFALGMVGLVQFLPLLVLMLVVGHAADRFDRRTIVAVCQIGEAVAIGAVGLATYFDRLRPAGIFVAVAALAVARSFEGPSTQALVPTLVKDDLVEKAIAWSSMAFQSASIAGPALGGLLYALGAHVPYALAAALFVIAAGFALSIPPRGPAPVKNDAPGDSVFSGIHYIFAHKNILGAISLDLFVVLLGGATALLPAFARDVLHTGPWGLGLLRLAPAVGAVLTSLYIARHPFKTKTGSRMFAAVAIFGVTTVGFALSRSLWLSLAMLLIMGAADVVSVIIRATMVQLETPNEMRGRVSAVNSLFIGTSNQLGEFESGVTAAWWGLIPATVIGGLGSIVIALVWMRLFPGLRRLEKLRAAK